MKLSFRKVLGVAFIIAALICIYFAFLQQEKYIQGNAEYKKISRLLQILRLMIRNIRRIFKLIGIP